MDLFQGQSGGFLILPRRRGDLPVGPVAVVGRSKDGVLAAVADGHELVGDLAPHHAGVGFDGKHVPQPDAAEDPHVGVVGLLVVLFQIGLGGVEAVGVLHGELPRPDQPRPGTGLVPVLGLDLVEHDGQLLVAVDLAADQRGDALLVGHGKEHVLVVPVPEAEQFRPHGLKAARLLPQLRGQHHGHEDLLPADPVHLFADDRFDPVDDPLPRGKQGIDPGGNRTDESAADKELMTGCFGIFWHFFQAAPHHLTHFHDIGSRECCWKIPFV